MGNPVNILDTGALLFFAILAVRLQIIFNPPFTGSVFQEEISKDLLALCKTKKTEHLFMALFIKMLKIGGRCASSLSNMVFVHLITITVSFLYSNLRNLLSYPVKREES